MVLIGAISFIVPALIKCYQEDILLGITVTGGFMIVIGLIMILTRKMNNERDTEEKD